MSEKESPKTTEVLMFARATQFDIDTTRIGLEAALKRFLELVLPELRKQQGYQGNYLMRTPQGKGLLITLWETEADAEAGMASGFYDEQIRKFMTVYRQPPGREHYEVVFGEVTAVAPQLATR